MDMFSKIFYGFPATFQEKVIIHSDAVLQKMEEVESDFDLLNGIRGEIRGFWFSILMLSF
jgi:hypothetical protein